MLFPFVKMGKTWPDNCIPKRKQTSIFFFADECRMLTGEAPDMSPLLCQAMMALQDRPVLYR